jgi:hypothetical protein
MPDDTKPQPRNYQGVMVSSTFTDLTEHRAALTDALSTQRLFPIAVGDRPPSLSPTYASGLKDAASFPAPELHAASAQFTIDTISLLS